MVMIIKRKIVQVLDFLEALKVTTEHFLIKAASNIAVGGSILAYPILVFCTLGSIFTLNLPGFIFSCIGMLATMMIHATASVELEKLDKLTDEK
jgi:hypothetical protein